MRLEFLEHLLQPLLEVAAIAGSREQRAHVEREHGCRGQHFRHLAVDDAFRKPFRDRGLADAGFADEQRVVLLPAAQHLDGAVDLGIAPDHRIDLAVARLLVEIDAVGIERLAPFSWNPRCPWSRSPRRHPRTGRASETPGRLAMPWLM